MESLTRVNASAVALTLGTSDRRGAKMDVTIALVPSFHTPIPVEGKEEEEEEAVVALELRARGGGWVCMCVYGVSVVYVSANVVRLNSMQYNEITTH